MIKQKRHIVGGGCRNFPAPVQTKAVKPQGRIYATVEQAAAIRARYVSLGIIKPAVA